VVRKKSKVKKTERSPKEHNKMVFYSVQSYPYTASHLQSFSSIV